MLSILLFLGLAALIVISTKLIMSRLNDLESALATINTELEKAQAEIIAAVAALQDQINNAGNPELSAGAQAQLDRLGAVAASLDALNPDAPAPAPEVPPANG
jgi:hypothetical protein